MQIAGITYDEKRKKQQDRYQGAVLRAKFLNKKEKEHWALLGYILTSKQLSEAESLIIDEDLRRLNTKHQLEKVKSNTEKRHA